MKIVIVTPYLPWPLNSGGNTAQYTLLDYLRKKHDFTLITLISQESYTAVAELEKRWPEVRIIPVENQPKALIANDSEIAGLLLKLLTKLERFFYSLVAFLKKKLQPINQEVKQKLKIPFYPFELLPVEMVKAVSNQLERESYDLIQIEFCEPLSLVHILPKSIKKLFVHYQIHYKVVQQEIETLDTSHPYYKYFLNSVKSQELHLLGKYDAIITLSENDRDTLQKELPHIPTYISPFPITLPDINEQALGSFHNKLVYLGGEQHYPNKDAVEWFLTDIWPEIFYKRPQFKFYIIGKWNNKTIKKYSYLQNVVFTGFIPSLSEILTSSIMIVPLRIGSGIRTKILDAMANGVPVVSTSIGCEGLAVKSNENIIIADQKNSFVEAVLELAEDFDLMKKLSYNGLKFIRCNYTQSVVGERRDSIYKTIFNSTEMPPNTEKS